MSESDHTVNPLILARRSSYAFDPRPLTRDQIHVLFEAARWAPSSFNEQPWRFLIATRESPGDHERLLSLMVDWNRTFAGRAPLVGLAAAKLSFSKNGKPNRHAMHDVGLAAENLALQAVAMGLQSYMVAGFDVDRAAELIGPQEDWIPVAMFVVGYAGRIEDLPERYGHAESKARTRLSLSEIVYDGEWGRGIGE